MLKTDFASKYFLEVNLVVTEKTHGPKMYVQKTFIKGRSYLVQFGNTERRPNQKVLSTSDSGRLKDVVFIFLFFLLPHSLRNFLVYVICYQLEKIENKNYKCKYQFIWNWQSMLTQMN